MNPSLLVSFPVRSPILKDQIVYITGNSSILPNILAWIGLWFTISFGLVAIYIALNEFSRWLNRRSLSKFNKRFDNLTEEYNNDIL